jgi:anaerobic ribonucleoside-triphosphate reductase activating protein
MYLGEILKADTANGIGMRVTIFVSGCTNKCPGCFQPETWDFEYGRLYTPEMEQMIMDELGKDYYDGLTLLGGDPMEESNQRGLLPLVERVKRELPGKSIWAYTGFVYDRDLMPGGKRYFDITDRFLECIDILVDGPFVLAEKDITLRFRGSRNQRIIDLKSTRQSGEIVLSELNS